MPESLLPVRPRPYRRVAAAALTGVLLAALTAAGGVVAALGGWLAQPAFALAVSWWRGSRAAGDRQHAAREALTLTLLWSAGLALTAALIAWPLLALRQTGSLGAAIGLSLAAGIALLGLWRTWPLWHAIEREGGTLPLQWRELDYVEMGAWRGLLVAVWIAAIAASAVLLAWPDLLAQPARWITAAVFTVASPMLHWTLQRTAAPRALGLWDTLEDDADDAASEPHAIDLHAIDSHEGRDALYAAARSGRVDRALALLEA
ncbi:MAG: hypothetical protein M3Q96_02080, partial [Pseudomonadota bacterium]|nr:hypothetical protein [Pseudomonadota bacterium]